MKKLILVLALSLGLGSAFAQKIKETEVPAAVKDGFKKQYPNAKVSEWEKEGANFEAEFKQNKVETSVVIDANGAILETEVEIAVKELPAAVSEYISKNYAGYKVDEATKITDSKGTVTYEAEVEKGKEEFDLIFDSNGSFIKKAS
ncbi:MAG: PepSY-like domain-containing protein [Sphingobacteriaceae bacterium]